MAAIELIPLWVIRGRVGLNSLPSPLAGTQFSEAAAMAVDRLLKGHVVVFPIMSGSIGIVPMERRALIFAQM
jgi:hypothetical protein